jgi:hypothetical protein
MIGGGLLSCAGDTVLPLTAGRLISGAGAILFNLVLTKMATDWFAGREIVFAMGSLMSSWPFGIALGLIVQGRIRRGAGLANQYGLGCAPSAWSPWRSS